MNVDIWRLLLNGGRFMFGFKKHYNSVINQVNLLIDTVEHCGTIISGILDQIGEIHNTINDQAAYIEMLETRVEELEFSVLSLKTGIPEDKIKKDNEEILELIKIKLEEDNEDGLGE